MFCPSAIEYGNVADWVSGVGALSAVVVALWIAFRKSWSLKKERELTEANEAMRMARLKGEVKRLLAEIETFCAANGRADRTTLTGLTTFENPLDRIEGIRFQLAAIQPLAASDPRLFGLIGRAHAQSEPARDILGARLKLMDMSARMKTLRQEVSELGQYVS